jgi:polar amino acid transport system substrate-binding protein
MLALRGPCPAAERGHDAATQQEMAVKFTRILTLVGLATCLATGVADAKEWKTVRIGMDATYPPFESVDSKGDIVGWEVDYAKLLCAKMKVTCTFQNQDWDGVIPALLSSKFDVIFSSMNETPARAKKVLFSDVYYATPPVIVGLDSNKSDDISPAAMKGKTIGVQSSTVFANYIEKTYPGVELKQYPGGDEPFLDLASGRIDYVMNDMLVAQGFIAKNPGCCRIITEVKRTPDVFGPGVGAAFRPEDTDLKAMFDKAIKEVDDEGAYKPLEEKYFKIDIRGK